MVSLFNANTKYRDSSLTVHDKAETLQLIDFFLTDSIQVWTDHLINRSLCSGSQLDGVIVVCDIYTHVYFFINYFQLRRSSFRIYALAHFRVNSTSPSYI